jgi:hypothetical protein
VPFVALAIKRLQKNLSIQHTMSKLNDYTMSVRQYK